MAPTPSSMPSPTSVMLRFCLASACSRPRLQGGPEGGAPGGQGIALGKRLARGWVAPGKRRERVPLQVVANRNTVPRHPHLTPLAGPASLATAALSAPSARDVPPTSPKLRISDRPTLQAGEPGRAGGLGVVQAVQYQVQSL